MFFLTALLPLLAVASASPLAKRYNGVKVQSTRNGQCLSPDGGDADGTRVHTVDCANARTWDINPGSGSVVLTGTNFALDAGTGRDNNEGVKLWTSYPGLFQQTWYFTNDFRIAITGGDQCLDQGNDQEGTQTWQCTTGNTNQEWHVFYPNDPTPDPDPEPPVAGHGAIRAVNWDDYSLTITGGYAGDGAAVQLVSYLPDNATYAVLQRWDTSKGTSGQQIKLTSDNKWCLDAGANPANGATIHSVACGDGAGQKWDFTNEGKLKVTGTNFCVDVKQESQYTPQKPYGYNKEIQIWECFDGNASQVFDI